MSEEHPQAVVSHSASVDSLMNLLEWTQHKIDSGYQIVREIGNRLDINFLKAQNRLNKQVDYNAVLWSIMNN